MNDVGVLTFAALPTPGDQIRRNAIAEVEERLRSVLAGRDLKAAFGGEPFHPGDRVITSLALGRLHLQHVIDAGARVVVLLLAGPADPAVVAALVRYLDARATPAFPVFLLGVEEKSMKAAAGLLGSSGELRALGRAHEAALASIRPDDPDLARLCDRISSARDDSAMIIRDLSFRDDLRRHHHLSVCPTGAAPPSWRLAPVQALERHGITAGVVLDDDVRARMRWLIGANADVLDPRLIALRGSRGDWKPGDLAAHAAALAIRDLADESLATTVTLGTRLPSGADPAKVAEILCAHRDHDGRVAIPLCASTGDDDAGALSRYLLERAAAPNEPERFRDPRHARPPSPAATLRIASISGGHALVTADSASAIAGLEEGPVTALRVAFGAHASTAAVFETAGAPRRADGGLAVPLPGRPSDFLGAWPADRMAAIPGRHARRVLALLSESGFAVTQR